MKKSAPTLSLQNPTARLFAALVAAGLAVSANAAGTVTWKSGATLDWNVAGNWTAGTGGTAPPVAGDTLAFGSTTGVTTLNNDLTAAISFAAITFNSGASAYTLGGNSITLAGNVTNNSTSLQAISFNISTTAVRTFTTTTGGGNLAVTGEISGAGGGIIKAGSGTLTITADNTYTGATTVSAGALTLNRATGSLAATALTFNSQGGTFNVDNTGATGALSQTLGALTFSAGESTVKLTRTADQDQVLTFASLGTRTAGASANFVSTGGTNSATNGFNFTTRAAVFFDQATFFNGDNYAWLDAANTFVRAMAYGIDTGAVTSAGATTLASATHQQITGAVSAQNTATFTTLKLAGASDLTLATGATLTTNGLLKTGGNAASLSGGTGLQAASGTELVIRTDAAGDSLTLNTPILANGSNALTKSGAGTLTLAATGNTYTGATKVIAGTLNLSGSLTGNTAISTSGTGVFTQGSTGVISGSSTFTQGSSGTSVLAGANSYSGVTNVSSGVLNIQNGSALGTTDGGTTVAAGAELQLQGGISVAEKLSIKGVLRSVSGNNILSGTISANAGLFVASGSKLTVTNTLSNTGTLSLRGGGDFVFNGNITGGRVDVGYSTAGLFTGTATFNGDNSGLTGSALKLFTGTVNLNSATSVGSNTLEFQGSTNYSDRSILNNTSGAALTLTSNPKIMFANIGSAATTFGTSAGTSDNSLNLGTGTVDLRSHTFTLNGSGSLTFGGQATNVVLNAANFAHNNITFTVNNGLSDNGTFGAVSFANLALTSDDRNSTVTIAGTGNVNITGAVINGGTSTASALIKSGSGILTLSGANTYGGSTTVGGGTLAYTNAGDVSGANSLGQSANIAANLLLGNGATLSYTGSTNGSTNRLFTINGTAAGHSATLDASGSGTITYSNTGALAFGTTNQTRTLNLTGSNTGTNTLASFIGNNGTGAVSVTKSGAGTWVLSGGNSFGGLTTVTGGTLVAGSANAFNLATGQVNVSGGTLDSSVANANFGGAINLSSGAVNINSNSAAGSLTLASGKNFTASGGTLTFNLGTAFDKIRSAGGSAKFDLTGSTLVLDTTGAGFSYGNTYQLFSGFAASTSVVGTARITGYDTAGFKATLSNGGELSFAASAIPEPATFAVLAGLGILGFAAYRRRRAS